MKRRICLLLSGLLAAAVLCLCACAAGTSETAPSETEAATAQSDTSAAKTEAAESKGSQRDESAVRVIWQPDENTERQTLKAKSPKPLQAAENPPVVELVSPYTYQMLETDLALLHKIYPAHFSYTSLGKTADGRQIYCAVVGTGHAKKQIVSDVGIHGAEYLNPPAVMQAIEYYLRNYDTPVYKGRTVGEILADTDLYIIPMLNPDGIAISQFGPDGLNDPAMAARVRGIYAYWADGGELTMDEETYYRVWKANANGVDLNRNYLFETTRLVYDTGVYRPAESEFAGKRAVPEAETAAYKTLVNGLSDPIAAISIHSQGNLIYWNGLQSEEGKAAARALALTIAGITGYRLPTENSFVGASADWAMIEKGIPAVTVETGGGAHNPLPAKDLPGIAARLRDVFLAVAYE